MIAPPEPRPPSRTHQHGLRRQVAARGWRCATRRRDCARLRVSPEVEVERDPCRSSPPPAIGQAATGSAQREVTDIRLVSSELKAAELEGKLLARIRQFDFGAKDVEVMVVSWRVDFLPP